MKLFAFRMIAKLVVWGQDRSSALNSLVSRLSEYHVSFYVEFEWNGN